jgi:hypothetical protein
MAKTINVFYSWQTDLPNTAAEPASVPEPASETGQPEAGAPESTAPAVATPVAPQSRPDLSCSIRSRQQSRSASRSCLSRLFW